MKTLFQSFSPYLTGVAATTVVFSFSSCKKENKVPTRYNIVYIMTDDHTGQMMSCYDTRYIETPNLDRIARDGVRFTNSFVANSLSGPSRACMLTGKHSHANGFTDNTTCVFCKYDVVSRCAVEADRRPKRRLAIVSFRRFLSFWRTGFVRITSSTKQGNSRLSPL